ncbi:MAG: hypothetical protein H6977_15380 [Gammaproteobacteria bacterium]|nr:hypothetical protein [Gammaproteobacteria bacterium]MCP5201383.1 hypothetical protein [Gammaproteobacteria bacterium]
MPPRRPGCRALLALALLLASASAAATLGEREAAVFEALLNHGLEPGTPIVVIAEETTGDPAAIGTHLAESAELAAELGAPPGTLDDWVRRNAQRVTIDRPLRLAATYQLLDAEQRAKLFSAEAPQLAWSQFFEHYRGAPGLIALSRAGFDADFEHALMYIEHHCGVECGAGRLVLLSLGADGAWHVNGAAPLWMADDVPVPAE